MNFIVIIPARYASARLRGKLLLDIGGKPMIRHVWERAMNSGASQVIVATDDDRIRSACEAFGAEAEMTAESHRSGTERIAEVAARMNIDGRAIIVNVQGDEPLIPPSLIAQVARNLDAAGEAQVATLCEPITDRASVMNPSVVKVVFDKDGYANYFSRAPIPWDRDGAADGAGGFEASGAYFRHIGIYAYRAGYLATYVSLPESAAELREKLEQLRVLHHGGRIHVAEARDRPGPGIDTQADLDKVRNMVERAGEKNSS